MSMAGVDKFLTPQELQVRLLVFWGEGVSHVWVLREFGV